MMSVMNNSNLDRISSRYFSSFTLIKPIRMAMNLSSSKASFDFQCSERESSEEKIIFGRVKQLSDTSIEREMMVETLTELLSHQTDNE